GMTVGCGGCGQPVEVPHGPALRRYSVKAVARRLAPYGCLFSHKVQAKWQSDCELLDGAAFAAEEKANPTTGRIEKTYSARQTDRLVEALEQRKDGRHQDSKGWWLSLKRAQEKATISNERNGKKKKIKPHRSTLDLWAKEEGCPHVAGGKVDTKTEVGYVIGTNKRTWWLEEHIEEARRSLLALEAGRYGDSEYTLAGAQKMSGLAASTIHRLGEEKRLTTKECANKRGRGKVRVTYDGAELKEIGKARRAQSAGVSFTPGTVLLTIPAAAKEICFPERRLRKAIKKGKLK